jgi:hypothetical protein
MSDSSFSSGTPQFSTAEYASKGGPDRCQSCNQPIGHACGACFRLFTRDIPEKPSLAASSYFVAVIVLLALVLRITPGHGVGMR